MSKITTTKQPARPPLADAAGSAPWKPMNTAPHNATDVEVKMRDGTVQVAHWASDLSGEEQPPFEGWFVDRGTYNLGIEEPAAWRPLPNAEVSEPGAGRAANETGAQPPGSLH